MVRRCLVNLGLLLGVLTTPSPLCDGCRTILSVNHVGPNRIQGIRAVIDSGSWLAPLALARPVTDQRGTRVVEDK